MLSASENGRTSPNRWRSAGTYATPASFISRGPAPVTSLPASSIRPPVGLRRPMIASTSSSWPLPATPAMPEDLARPDLEVDRADGRVAAVVGDLETRHAKGRPGRVRFAAVHGQLDRSADHQLGEVRLVGLRRDPLADDLAAPDDGDPVGDLEDLVQLVADEDDAVTRVGQPPEDPEDLLGLLRRQDRRRLVEDEDLRVAVQDLEDLDPLLPADRERADLGVGVDLEAEPLTELADPPAGLLAVEEDRVGHRLLAEEDVLGDGEDGDQHEVLVDHVDATGDGVGRAGDRHRLAVEQDLRPRWAWRARRGCS